MSELTEPATTGTILLSQPVYKTLISGSEIEPCGATITYLCSEFLVYGIYDLLKIVTDPEIVC